jgi:hypothetical protein
MRVESVPMAAYRGLVAFLEDDAAVARLPGDAAEEARSLMDKIWLRLTDEEREELNRG